MPPGHPCPSRARSGQCRAPPPRSRHPARTSRRSRPGERAGSHRETVASPAGTAAAAAQSAPRSRSAPQRQPLSPHPSPEASSYPSSPCPMQMHASGARSYLYLPDCRWGRPVLSPGRASSCLARGFNPGFLTRKSTPLTAGFHCWGTRCQKAASGPCGDAVSLRQQRRARQAPIPTAFLAALAGMAPANLTSHSTVYTVLLFV